MKVRASRVRKQTRTRLASKQKLLESFNFEDDEADEEPNQETSKRTTTTVMGHVVPIEALPCALFGSLMLSAMCMLGIEAPLADHSFGTGSLVWSLFAFLYLVTFACQAYCALADPGQFRGTDTLPKRTHKAWTHEYPIRRYDHYCRWIMNSIGLLNHREFFTMLCGLVAIAVIGFALDVIILLVELYSFCFMNALLISMHLAYSLVLGYCARGILELHVGFISRNELACEWKEDTFYYVVDNTKLEGGLFHGKSVKDLPEEKKLEVLNKRIIDLREEYDVVDDTFDGFDNETLGYVPELNEFDKGFRENWMNFWFTPRWTPDQLGEF